jgi:flagellar basal body-associated protein FliL
VLESRSDSDPNAQNVIAILKNLESLSLFREDTSESTVTTLAVTMKKEEDAKDLKETVEGFVAMLKMIASFSSDIDETGKKAIGLLSQIKFEQKAQTVSASLSYNTPAIEDAIKELLAKGVEELKK